MMWSDLTDHGFKPVPNALRCDYTDLLADDGSNNRVEQITPSFETIRSVCFDAFGHDAIVLEVLNGITPP